MNTNVQTGSGLFDIVTDAANKIKDETKKQSSSMFNLFSKESQPDMPEVQAPNLNMLEVQALNMFVIFVELGNKYGGGKKRRKSKSKKHKKHKKSLKKIVKRKRKNNKNTKHKKHKKTVRKTSKRKY
jgi:hypothetical protein